MDQIVKWITEHLIEIALPSCIIVGLIVHLALKSYRAKGGNQVAKRDIKNATVVGDNNKINIQ